MNSFLQKFSSNIKGVITGFNRIVFKGTLRPLMFPKGAMSFLRSRGVLNKNYKSWVISQSKALVDTAEAHARKHCGEGIVPIPSSMKRKEALAHKRQLATGIKNGLIGVWSSVEACSTFLAVYDPVAGFPQLRHKYSRCKHLYFYYDHPDYGFMSVRLQTWFPYSIQIAVNGRVWLRRSLDKHNIPFLVHGNKFPHIDDYPQAQTFLDAQCRIQWIPMLSTFIPSVFPNLSQMLGNRISYYWSVWQSEWATDFIFDSPESLAPVMDKLLRHSLMTRTCDRVLRYMGRPVNPAGQPHPLANPELMTRVNLWHDGMRIRHWVDKNSVKLYNEHNIIRVEMTMNNPAMFRVWRRAEGAPASTPKRRLALRKRIADFTIRAQIANNVNRRFISQMATLNDNQPIRELLGDISMPKTINGRTSRALDILGKDRQFLQALADPAHSVGGITNKALRRQLAASPWAKGGTDKQLSARVSRHIRLLRDHGLIRKIPNQRKYLLTAQGQLLTTALNAILSSSTRQLVSIAA